MNNKWFTLVELIVVITILAILWTIALYYNKCDWDLIRSEGICMTQDNKDQKEIERQKQWDINADKRTEKYNIKFCIGQAKKLINWTMSDTWGNDEYNTKFPTELMDKVYFDCINKIK